MKVRFASRFFSAAAKVFLVLLILAAAVYGISSAASAADEAGLRTAEESIRRAAVSCYALEGFYPPDYAYLRAHYGVRVDEARYAVHYEVFASNVMPQITVMPLS